MQPRQLIYQGEPLVFRAGEEKSIAFSADAALFDPSACHARLFVKGEPIADAALLSEWGGGLFLRDIDDSLSTVTHHSRYSLRFLPTDEAAPRRAYYKLRTSPLLYPGGLKVQNRPQNQRWKLSFYSKGEGFTAKGEAELRAEIFYRTPERDLEDICGEADEILHFPIPEGSYDFQKVSCGELLLDDRVATVLFTLSVGASEGTVYVEDISLTGETDISLLPSWMPHSPYATSLNWFGENLSHREWSEFAVSVNGTELGKHAFFSSIYRYNENEVALPDGILQGENQLTLCYQPNYFSPYPYHICEIWLLIEPIQPFYILSHPHTAAVGKRLTLAIETAQPELTIELASSRPEVVPVTERCCFRSAGLHVVEFAVKEAVGETELTLSGGGYREILTLARTVERGDDGILCGTGDAIYIPQKSDAMRRYLKWYLQEECGNFLTLRPVYHWSGTKSLQSDVWRELIPFFNRLQMPYCLLFDERELVGLNANPTKDLLAGEYFLGYQGHERDGAYNYWSNDMWNCDGNFYRELRARNLKHPDLSYRMPVHYRNGQGFVYYDPAEMTDQKAAADYFEQNVGACQKGLIRHTGVTLLFRHFLRTGTEVPGAEIMYSSHELLLSGLRGAAAAYQKPVTASHLALQWHSEPMGYAGFHERYALSLRLSYLHGVSHINTEERLWRMEFGFESHDRFSPACLKNIEEKRRFLRLIQTHTRRGTPAHKHGILYGACDGFTGYGGTTRPVWHNPAAGWEFGAPEQAWEHLKLFYPDAAITQKIANRVRVREEQGWFSRTPYGLCDILPVEAPDELLASYPYLAFLGYHLADEAGIQALVRYVQGGGKLLLCLCHLSDDADRSVEHANDYCTHLAEGYRALTGFAISGVSRADGFRAAEGDMKDLRVLATAPSGAPLLLENRIGQGSVLVVNSFEFPSHPAISALYAEQLRTLADCAKASDAAAGEIDIGSAPVEYAIYDRGQDARRIYLVNTAWNRSNEIAQAELLLDGKRYSLPVPFGQMGIVEICAGLAAYTVDETTEVLALSATPEEVCITLQGEGEAALYFYGAALHSEQTAELTLVARPDGGYDLTTACNGKKNIYLRRI